MKTAEELAIERAQLAQFNANLAGGAPALTTKRAIKHHETKAKTRPKANRVPPSCKIASKSVGGDTCPRSTTPLRPGLTPARVPGVPCSPCVRDTRVERAASAGAVVGRGHASPQSRTLGAPNLAELTPTPPARAEGRGGAEESHEPDDRRERTGVCHRLYQFSMGIPAESARL